MDMAYSKNLEKAAQINIILLNKLVEVCEANHIRYYLDAGALLGSARHKDFIPWDDDVDIALMREDYMKLLALPKEVWGDDFEMVSSQQVAPNGFLDFTTRLIYLKESIPLRTYEKVGQMCEEKYINKLGVDVFILDKAYEKEWQHKLHVLRLTAIYGMAMGHREYLDYSEYGFCYKIVIFILSTLGKMRKLKNIQRQYDKVSQAVKKNTGRVFYSNYPIKYVKLSMPAQWYGEPIEVPIREYRFPGPAEYDKVLRTVYGDYMKLPSEEKRVPQHVLEDE